MTDDFSAREPPTLPDREQSVEVAPTVDFSDPAGASTTPLDGLPALPGYELLSELGRGGMGVVYKARQLSLNRVVALKMLLHSNRAGTAEHELFQREAEAIARLQHPNIVGIYEVGLEEGQPFLAMEFCAGGSLAAHLKGRPLPITEAARLVATLARAIEAAHLQGIIHRDLKPANVLLQMTNSSMSNDQCPMTNDQCPMTNDQRPIRGKERLDIGHWSLGIGNWALVIPKITDFGLTKRLDGVSSLTPAGAILGTPAYMPPEQARGKTGHGADCRSDVYGLGAILYELLTGRPPFLGESALDTIVQVLRNEPVPPSRLQPKCPRDLETICLQCLRKEPHRRYVTALALAEDLERFLAGKPVLARPIRLWERGVKWARRRPAVAALTGLLLLAVVLGNALVLWQWRQTERQRRATVAALATAEGHRYRNGIALADREWQAGNVARAEEVLADCPVELRGWEWHYLHRRCHTERFRLRGNDAVAFRPDGRRLALARDEEVLLVEAEGGKVLRRLRGHTSRVTGLAFGPRGQRLASSADDGTVRLWDTATGQALHRLSGASAFTSVAWSRHGSKVAAGGGRQVFVWATTSGKLLKTLQGHEGVVSGVAFSPTANLLASASADGTVRIRDVADGKTLRVLTGHEGIVHAVAFHPSGRELASAGIDGTMRLWRTADGRSVRTLRDPDGPVICLAYSADGGLLAAGGGDFGLPGTLRLWDPVVGRLIRSYRGHARTVRGLAFGHPKGQPLLLASADQEFVAVWDATRNQEARILRGHNGPVGCVCFSPDGRTLATGGDGSIHLWPARDGGKVSVLKGHGGAVSALAFSADGQTLASAGDDHLIVIWDPGSDKIRRILRGHTAAVLSVAFSADGQRLASASLDGTLRLWEVASGKEIGRLIGHTGAVTGVAFQPGGRLLASCGHDRTVRLWNATTGAEVRVLQGHTTPASVLAFDRTGRTLASAGGSATRGEILIRDVESGGVRFRLAGHGARVLGLAFNPAGNRLVSGGKDRALKLWDVSTGREVLSLSVNAAGVPGVTFSPDGTRIAAACADGSARIWDSSPKAGR